MQAGGRTLVAATQPVALAWRRTAEDAETLVLDGAATLDLWPLDATRSIARIVAPSGADVPMQVLPGGGARVALASGTVRLVTSQGVDAEAEIDVARLGLTVHPSPSRGAVTFGLTLPSGGREADVRVVDALGRTVWQARATGPLAWDGRRSDGADLAPGVYVVEVRVGRDVVRRPLVRLR